MENMTCRRLIVLAAACGVSWAGGVRADAADAFNVSLGQGILWDDNVFRLSDDADARALIGSSARGDTITTTFAGASFDQQAGRQHWRASLDASNARYARFSRLDHNGTALKGNWNWELGKPWYGEIAYSRSEALTDFGDFRSSVKNINTARRWSYGANYRVHPDWSVGASAFLARSDNSSALREANQYELDGTEAVVQFTRPGNNGALRLRRTNGNYPNPEATLAGLIDNSYRQDEIEGSLAWHPTGATSFTAYIARVRRSHEQLSQRDFSGVTGTLAWDWLISAKTQFNIRVRREVGVQDEGNILQDEPLSSYVVTRGMSLGPRWSPTARTSVQAMFGQDVRSYQGDPVAALGGSEQREDRLRHASLSFGYAPITSLQFSMTWRHEQRESNLAGFPYRANAVSANARFSF